MPEYFPEAEIPTNPLRNNSLLFNDFIVNILSEQRLNNKNFELENLNLKKLVPLEYKNENTYFQKNNTTDFFSRTNIESDRLNEIFDRRIDRIFRDSNFIREELQSIERPQVESRARVFRSKTGLLATPGKLYEGISITANGEQITAGGEPYTRIDFMPEGRTYFVGAKMTDSIAKGIEGLVELVAAVERGEFEVAGGILLGHTNLNMALISQRLGFKITDQSRNSDGTINKSLHQYEVIARFEDVKKAVKAFQEQGHAQRVLKRQKRLNPGAQPA